MESFRKQNKMTKARGLPKSPPETHSSELLLKVGSGCSLLQSQERGKVGGKESLLYFRGWQLAGVGGDGGGCRCVSVQGLTPPHPPLTTRGRGFYRQKRGLRAETAPSALTSSCSWSRWAEQQQPDFVKHSLSSVPGSVCSHVFETSSWNGGSEVRA